MSGEVRQLRRAVSYGNLKFLVVLARSATGLLPVELKSFRQGNAQSLQKFISRCFPSVSLKVRHPPVKKLM
jgi:hypothetical protein